MKFSYDYGHLEGGQDGSASGIVYEYAEVRKYGAVAIAALRAAGHECIDCTPPNGTPTLNESLQYRVNKANASGSQLHICFHINAFNGAAYGAEVEICGTGGMAEKYANAVLNEICTLGFYKRGVKTPSLFVTRETNMPAILIEPFFCDNANDCKIYDANKLGNAIAKAVISIAGGSVPVPQPIAPAPTPVIKHAIMGNADLTVGQMIKYVLDNNAKPDLTVSIQDLAEYFLEEGKAEGVRGDIAFCQSIKETGFFKYGGQVLSAQNNFAGIGATNNSPIGKGAWFETAREGVRAQIQHLKAYASRDALSNTRIDPRYDLVSKGIAPNWEDLNGKWAVPGENYGQEILSIYAKVKEVKADVIPVVPKPPIPPVVKKEYNAVVAKDWLYTRYSNGAIEQGHRVDIGDKIKVIDVSYTKQLARVIYPTSKGPREAYVTNNSCIQYTNKPTYISVYKDVYDRFDGSKIGSISQESVIILEDLGSKLNIVYSTDKGQWTKSGVINK